MLSHDQPPDHVLSGATPPDRGLTDSYAQTGQTKAYMQLGFVTVRKPLTEYIEKYESEYDKLLNLMKSSQDSFYSVDYYGVMVQDKVRKNLLLSALVPHNPALVDNLMSNQALSYEDVKNHLCTLPSKELKEGFVDGFDNGGGSITTGGATATVKVDKAMIAGAGVSEPRCKRLRAKNAAVMTPRALTMLRCHFCHNIGHLIRDCRKRKFAERQRGNTTTTGTGAGVVLVATASAMPLSNVCTPCQWKLDTCATAHMCDTLEQFTPLSMSDGVVTVGSDIPLQVAWKGTVSLHRLLPSQSNNDRGHCRCHRFKLLDVLYVPTLRHCLVSWSALRSDYELNQRGSDFHVYRKNGGMLVWVAQYINGFPFICLANHCALPVTASNAVPINAIQSDANVDIANRAVQDAVQAIASDAASNDRISYWHFVL